MIPLSVPEIEGGYPERYGGEEEGEEGEEEEEGLVLEYSKKLDKGVNWVLGIGCRNDASFTIFSFECLHNLSSFTSG